MRSTKRIGKFGTRTKIDFPAGRSFFVQCRNTSLLTSGGVGTYLISTSNAGETPRTLFVHAAASTCNVLATVLQSRMRHLDNGTGSFRIELSVQDAVNGNFLDEGAVPEQADCDGDQLSFERSGLFFTAHEGKGLSDRTTITSNVSVRPSVIPTVCSFLFAVEFYVIFTNPPAEINPSNITGVTITAL